MFYGAHNFLQGHGCQIPSAKVDSVDSTEYPTKMSNEFELFIIYINIYIYILYIISFDTSELDC